jgi:hypothetical protein
MKAVEAQEINPSRGPRSMTVQQIVRDILERAIEDGLVAPASAELRFGPASC